MPKITDRVVTLSSVLHPIRWIDMVDLNWETRRYRRWQAYGDSTVANLMFGKELASRLSESGSAVKSLIAHPGYAATELQVRTETFADKVMQFANRTPIVQSAADGALPVLYAASARDVASAAFYDRPNSSDYMAHLDFELPQECR